jgi:hypothetical protein
MAGGGSYGGGGHGETHEYAFEGYPVSEVRFRYGLKAYKLEQHEHESIKEIKGLLAKNRGYNERDTCEQHLAYLESLSKKLNLIISSEEHEGIMNLELRQTLSDIRGCCVQLTKKIDALEAYY